MSIEAIVLLVVAFVLFGFPLYFTYIRKRPSEPPEQKPESDRGPSKPEPKAR